MNSSVNSVALSAPRAVSAVIDGMRLRVTVEDGREISVPIDRFEFLERASEADRADLRLIGNGRGVWWEQLEEGVSVPQLFGLPADS